MFCDDFIIIMSIDTHWSGKPLTRSYSASACLRASLSDTSSWATRVSKLAGEASAACASAGPTITTYNYYQNCIASADWDAEAVRDAREYNARRLNRYPPLPGLARGTFYVDLSLTTSLSCPSCKWSHEADQ